MKAFLFSSLVYISENVISFNIAIEFYGNQAAHPDGGNDPITIYLKTGKPLVLEHILSLACCRVPAEHSDKWGFYSERVCGPKLLALKKKLHPKQLTTAEECDYSVVDPWQFAQFYITKNGLYLAPSFPQIVDTCRNSDWSFIPFKALSDHRNAVKKIVLP